MPIYSGQYVYICMIVVAIAVNFAVVFWCDGTLTKNLRMLPIVIGLMCTMMYVEHLAMWSALVRFVSRRELAWTTWTRQGVDGVGAALESITTSVLGPPPLAASPTTTILSVDALVGVGSGSVDDAVVMDEPAPVGVDRAAAWPPPIAA